MAASKEDQQAVQKSDRRMFFTAVFAHGSARVLSKVASAPLERVKVCLQVAAFPPRQVPVGGTTAGPVRAPALFLDLLAHQGPRALWRGSATHITATCLGGVTRLSLLRTSQMWAMPGGDSHYQGLGAYLRRCCFLYAAGTAALFVAYPMDVAYTCMAADNASPRRYRGFLHFARLSVREHGLLSLYRGFPLSLATGVPFVAVATGVHDLLAPLLLRQQGRPPEVDVNAAKPGDLFWLVRDGAPAHLFPWNLLLGAFSGFVAQSATYPLDTLRRRWQHACAGPKADAPPSLRQCASQLYEAGGGGMRAFYAGFGANAAKLVPELLVLCGAYLAINASGNIV